MTAAVTGVGLAGLVTFGVKTAASLEQAEIGFKTLLGSGQRSKVFLEDLKTFAAGTPFELPGLIESSRTLLGVGLNAKGVIPLLQAFGDTAGAVGVGQDAFQRIMLATSQAISAGKFQAGDLNQIMTNGIPIWSILSRAMGKPVPELRKMAEQGRLLSKDVLPLLQKQMTKDYGGAMAEQSKTLAGVWSTLKDTVAIGLADAIKPLVPLLSDLVPKAAALAQRGLSAFSLGVRALVSAFQDNDVTSDGFVGGMERIGVTARAVWGWFQTTGLPVIRALWSTLGNGAGILIDIVKWFREHDTVAKVLLVTLGALVTIYKVTAAVQAIQAAGLVAYLGLTNAVRIATVTWTGVQWLLNAALTANPIGLVIVAIAALVAVIVLIATKTTWFQTTWRYVWTFVKDVAQAVGDWFTATLWPSLKRAFDQLVGAARFMADMVSAYFRFWRDTALAVYTFVRDKVLSPLARFISVTVPEAFRSGVGMVSRIWDGLKEAAARPARFVIDIVFNKIGGVFNRIADFLHLPSSMRVPAVSAGFARGGRLPGYSPDRDDTIAMGPGGRPVMLAGGEFITNARQARRWLPLLEAINEGRVPGFQLGGLVDFFRGPAQWVTSQVSGPLRDLRARFGGPIGEMMVGLATKVRDGVIELVKTRVGLGGPGGSGMGSAAQTAWIRQLFPGVPILSADRPGDRTLTGNVSYHAMRRAIDLPPWMQIFWAIKNAWQGRGLKELIFSPEGHQQVWNDRDHLYGEPVRGQHWNHVHWAMRRGGLVPLSGVSHADVGRLALAPGANLVFNGTGAPEHLATDDGSLDEVVTLLRALLTAVQAVPGGLGDELRGTSRGMLTLARGT